MDILNELEVRILFPQLESGRFSITSPKTSSYNCIAWAVGDQTRWWWPDSQNYWPRGVPRKRNVESFVQLFASHDYEVCESSHLEEGIEKIAIFAGPTGTPTHAARQLRDGSWTSKLGQNFDISHVLEQVGGFAAKGYGTIAIIMKRPCRNRAWAPGSPLPQE